MTKIEKLDLINSIKVLDFGISGEEVEYISVEDSKENRFILRMIGMTDKKIEEECFPNEGCLDLVNVGFGHSDTWSEDKGFYIEY